MPLIETHDASIYYKDYRQSATELPLVLIHGAGGMYLDFPIDLRRELPCIALDLPGHGRSPRPARDSIKAYAADVIGLLDALDISRAIFVGHSMGGAIALTLALDCPEYTAGLVLISTGARLPVNTSILDGLQTDTETTIENIIQWSWARHIDPNFKQQGIQRLLETPLEVLVADYRACQQFDRSGDIHRLRIPTAIIVGEDDKMTPPLWSQFIVRSIPHSALYTLPRGGHMLPLEQPAAITHIIEDYLEIHF